MSSIDARPMIGGCCVRTPNGCKKRDGTQNQDESDPGVTAPSVPSRFGRGAAAPIIAAMSSKVRAFRTLETRTE